MLRASAASFAGGGESFMPRPRRASGAATTNSGTYPTFSSSSRIPTAIREVPKKTKGSFEVMDDPCPSWVLFFFLDFVIDMRGFVDIENAFEMVHLVLEDVR